jgi:predicted RNA-binding protein with EMAP domain
MRRNNHSKFLKKLSVTGLFNIISCSNSLSDFQQELRRLSNGLLWDKDKLNLIIDIIKEDKKYYKSFIKKWNELRFFGEITEDGKIKTGYSTLEE